MNCWNLIEIIENPRRVTFASVSASGFIPQRALCVDVLSSCLVECLMVMVLYCKTINQLALGKFNLASSRKPAGLFFRLGGGRGRESDV